MGKSAHKRICGGQNRFEENDIHVMIHHTTRSVTRWCAMPRTLVVARLARLPHVDQSVRSTEIDQIS